MSSQPTSHRQTIGASNNALRNLHNKRSWRRPETQPIRSNYHLKAETPNATHHTAYELRDGEETLGTIELDHFAEPDDLVRFVNSAIKEDFETARTWALNEPTIGWEGQR